MTLSDKIKEAYAALDAVLCDPEITVVINRHDGGSITGQEILKSRDEVIARVEKYEAALREARGVLAQISISKTPGGFKTSDAMRAEEALAKLDSILEAE